VDGVPILQTDIYRVPRPAEVAHLLTPLQARLKSIDVDSYIDARRLSAVAFQKAKAACESEAVCQETCTVCASGEPRPRCYRRIAAQADAKVSRRAGNKSPQRMQRKMLQHGQRARQGLPYTTGWVHGPAMQQRAAGKLLQISSSSSAPQLQSSIQRLRQAATSSSPENRAHAVAEFLDAHVNYNHALTIATMSPIVSAIQGLSDDMKVSSHVQQGHDS
jgi:hypothetical protein